MIPLYFVYFVISVVLFVTGLGAYVRSDQGIWLNLFSEFIGVAFTIVILEQLISAAERHKTKPARYAAFIEALMIYGRSVGLLIEIIKSGYNSSEHKEIISKADISIFNPEIGNIISMLNLENEAPVIPKRTWRAYLNEQAREIEIRIDRCLQRYSIFMDPELISIFQKLETTSFLSIAKLMISMPVAAQQLGFKGSPYFGWGVNNSASDFFLALEELGIFLMAHRAEFAGMKKIPDEIDLKHIDIFNDLRSMNISS